MRVPLQGVAAAWCLLLVLLLSIVQFFGASAPPLSLYLVFVGVWIFGAVMLYVAPRFGAWGTAAYGVILGIQVFRMHGGSALNWGIAIASFAATGLALAYLATLRRQSPPS